MRVVIERDGSGNSFAVDSWNSKNAATVLNRIKLQLDLAKQLWPEEFRGVRLYVDKRRADKPIQ